ncbi:Holliday junction resolvase RuvX [Dokdonella sp.]|uniref:Holliday junction resolvase RuvX n=1 Tax=Dokdonella sp. TaxID=2291710 RepID=UPI00352972EB
MSLSEPAGYVLGFDVGTRLIGVAIGHPMTGTARALATVKVTQAKPDWNALDGLVREWQPVAMVIGLPLALDGSEQAMTAIARAFGRKLAARYSVCVHEADERFTSKEAARRFASQRAQGTARRKHGADIDALAAQIILESWLALPGNNGSST